ncbi:type 1 glutamine amidotransferase [Solirubrobacter ginsenosidimutans]|uniref:Type 1 glutamine amidotransferase n=1 Tax=Solirubrobacter ginsenosidimutans TaxID=490573 RepID=A0A9X3MTJ0_9ACTN|nr:type 1 glutamine amidotransferase [Solirubrobacter ginsenosidimutans]MDA0162756.1 type 1 glutamine amidotransferase [Solirubrobacter ginsenosidimutans]
MPTTYPRIAVIHHLQQPFLGNAAAPLGEVTEYFDGALPDLDTTDAIVSFGGEKSAWDPEFVPEVELIREAVAHEIPFLGVCLGAQLLAHACGGEVSRLPRRLITWAPIEPLDTDDPVLGAIPPGAHALHWNEDGIEPPPGAVEILKRPQGSRAEGFRIGRLAWGVQFHPEIDEVSLDGWYAEWGELLEPAGKTVAGAREADARHLPGQAALSTAIFGAFARLVRTRPAAPSAHA